MAGLQPHRNVMRRVTQPWLSVLIRSAALKKSPLPVWIMISPTTWNSHRNTTTSCKTRIMTRVEKKAWCYCLTGQSHPLTTDCHVSRWICKLIGRLILPRRTIPGSKWLTKTQAFCLIIKKYRLLILARLKMWRVISTSSMSQITT